MKTSRRGFDSESTQKYPLRSNWNRSPGFASATLGSTTHEIALMCDDIEGTIAELQAKGIEFRGEPTELDFGITITMLLPGGVEVLLYEPKHPRAIDL